MIEISINVGSFVFGFFFGVLCVFFVALVHMWINP